jgi:hypothetical protein
MPLEADRESPDWEYAVVCVQTALPVPVALERLDAFISTVRRQSMSPWDGSYRASGAPGTRLISQFKQLHLLYGLLSGRQLCGG